MDVGPTEAMIAGVFIGLVAAGAGTGWWWSRRLGNARRLIGQLKASRDLLNQQNSQARRQIEQLQLELGELRIIAERVRRRAANTVSPPDSLGAPLEPRGMSPLAHPVVALRAGGAQASAGFVRTDYDEADDSGFAPTQIDRSQSR